MSYTFFLGRLPSKYMQWLLQLLMYLKTILTSYWIPFSAGLIPKRFPWPNLTTHNLFSWLCAHLVLSRDRWTWESPNLVVSNLVVWNFYTEALFCALLRPFALFALFCAFLCSFTLFYGLAFALFLRTFALFCALLRPTAFRTTAKFGNCRWTAQKKRTVTTCRNTIGEGIITYENHFDFCDVIHCIVLHCWVCANRARYLRSLRHECVSNPAEPLQLRSCKTRKRYIK